MSTPDNNTTLDKVTKWIPDRKAVTGGIAGVVSFFVLNAVPDLDPEVVGGLIAGIMGVAFYLVPPSKADLIRRADDTIKALGKEKGADLEIVTKTPNESTK